MIHGIHSRRRWALVGAVGASLCIAAATMLLVEQPSIRPMTDEESAATTGRCDEFKLELKVDAPEGYYQNGWLNFSFSGLRKVDVPELDGTITLSGTGKWTNKLAEQFDAEWLVKYENSYNHFYAETGGTFSTGGTKNDIFGGVGLHRKYDAGTWSIDTSIDIKFRDRYNTDGGGEFVGGLNFTFRW